MVLVFTVLPRILLHSETILKFVITHFISTKTVSYIVETI